jgi:lipoprotein-anchoring transpeptidase ErfK/SrfK
MDRQPARLPWHTFPFWFVLFASVGVTAGWKFGLFRDSHSEPVTDAGTAEVDLSADPGPTKPGQTSPWARRETETTVSATVESIDAPPPQNSEPAAFSPPAVAQTDAAPSLKPLWPAAPQTEPAPAPAGNPFSKSSPEFQAASTDSTAPAFPGEALVRTAAIDDPASTRKVVPIDLSGPADAGPGIRHVGAEEERAKRLPQHDFTAVDALIDDGSDVDANMELSKLYWKHPELRPQLKARLQQVAHRIYFQPENHFIEPYVVQPGDILQTVAKDYHVSWQYLAKLNRTKPERIRPGQKLKVIEGPFSAIVELDSFTLTVHAHGHFVAAFPIGTGKNHSTPVGKFTVKEKLVDPTYYGAEGVIEHDDPKNPLGEYWLDLGNSYGIHGTIDPDSIGKAESKGCIRLRDADIAAVYDLLGIGSEVVIRK